MLLESITPLPEDVILIIGVASGLVMFMAMTIPSLIMLRKGHMIWGLAFAVIALSCAFIGFTILKDAESSELARVIGAGLPPTVCAVLIGLTAKVNPALEKVKPEFSIGDDDDMDDAKTA